MQVKATAKNIRISAKKVRLVVDQIKKLTPEKALMILEFTQKSSSYPLKKVIASAVANAKNNYGLDQQNLKFKTIEIGEGPAYKRFRPVSRGRAHAILKRTSNISIVLEAEEAKKASAAQTADKKVETVEKQPEAKTTTKQKEATK